MEKKKDITCVRSTLSERDLDILGSLRDHRLLTTALIRRLHFPSGGQHTPQGTSEEGSLPKRHATEAAASVATMRVLSRLESHGLVARLFRRIGGVRAGSNSLIWQLTSAGERLTRQGNDEGKRRRYLEPSAAFTFHTLATAELAVELHELAGNGAIELVDLESEPDCWRTFLAPHGAKQWLKPDLFAITAGGEFEDHWFLEADLGTEHTPVIVRKATTYQQYAATGTHQSEHEVFPVVAFVVPDERRKGTIEAALKTESTTRESFAAGMFRVVTKEGFSRFVAKGGA
ncbi:replication-relaxation family protein [Streptomyces sp. MNU76]|uniref:replication-relaxation family protein n=1 Tax=Streptomyces sp. MNU76 TaxID=2560026 RepID=UPI001E6001CE|nr:replication-relaxation family protein [Streptomyces sp. MNU76]MCC9710219.1 replication-relaxation family protein [Streptomyces sp. MNU76]